MNNKQAIEQEMIKLVFGLAGAVITVLVMRKMMGPDLVKTAKMRMLLHVKSTADTQVKFWQDIRGYADHLYDVTRL